MDITNLLQSKFDFQNITIQIETHSDNPAYCEECQDPLKWGVGDKWNAGQNMTLSTLFMDCFNLSLGHIYLRHCGECVQSRRYLSGLFTEPHFKCSCSLCIAQSCHMHPFKSKPPQLNLIHEVKEMCYTEIEFMYWMHARMSIFKVYKWINGQIIMYAC